MFAFRAEQGDEIVNNLLRRSEEWLSWIEAIKPSRRNGSLFSRYTWLKTMQQALDVAGQFERNEISHQYNTRYELHIRQYQNETQAR